MHALLWLSLCDSINCVSTVDSYPHSILSKGQHRVLLLGAILTGFALRLHQLGALSLWYDEAVSVLLARMPLPQMLAHTTGDIHPPGYYALLHAWQTLTHPSLNHGLEFLFAWPSLWFGMLIPALLYPISRTLLDDDVALLSVWLAALSPFQLWYSQEVRMYTLGAAMGLLCFWMLLVFDRSWSRQSGNRHPGARRISALTVYAVAAALGLYTLYYFTFLLVALNVIALLMLLSAHRRAAGFARSSLLQWLAAQLGVLLLWSPWLPTFWRQATDPPVPVWRSAWSGPTELLASVVESSAALTIGQTAPAGNLWLWALFSSLILLLTFYYYTKYRRGCGRSLTYLTIYSLLPIALIFTTSMVLTPLYHVRYVYPYAPAFLTIMAAAVVGLWAQRHWLGTALLITVIAANALGLHAFWTDNRYLTDDHRQAVADLAQAWQPGDSILVNAGWIYPALEIYWPTDLPNAMQALPPPISTIDRLSDREQLGDDAPASGPSLTRSGSIDGDANLGWGNPESDFYAISRAETLDALETLRQGSRRIWHYRLYDTVSDPQGVIRAWLQSKLKAGDARPYPGRDFLQVQLFRNAAGSAEPDQVYNASFGDDVDLVGHSAPDSVETGRLLHVTLFWHAGQATADPVQALSVSLRLYDEAGRLRAQQDAPLRLGVEGQPLTLTLPAAARPGTYSLEAIVYGSQTGIPLTPADETRTVHGERRQLGPIQVYLPNQPPNLPAALARFDYLDLLAAEIHRGEAVAGGDVNLDLVWRPTPSNYADTYRGRISLRNSRGEEVQSWTELLGGDAYPSSVWPTGYPVHDPRTLHIADSIAPGEYELFVQVERVADALPIAARRGWWPISQDALSVGSISIVDR